MREIKFRAWNKKHKVMRYDAQNDVVDILEKPELIHKVGGFSHTTFFAIAPHDANIELMQYTGLHDKNGKEIWEGDKVRFLSGLDIQEHETEVIYKDGAFREGYFNGVLALCPWFEVIGNIYEG